jgi:hypothetical protein
MMGKVKGKRLSDEHRKKISEAMRVRTLRWKLSERIKKQGVSFSPDGLEKVRETTKNLWKDPQWHERQRYLIWLGHQRRKAQKRGESFVYPPDAPIPKRTISEEYKDYGVSQSLRNGGSNAKS